MTIAPETKIGVVSIAVSDLERALAFYENALGFRQHRRQGQRAFLGAGGPDLLILNEVPGAQQTKGTTGLYHFAILLPTRLDLARFLRHFADNDLRLQGFSDHLVSEAIYLSDPDGNGIEVYRDRPRSQWPQQDGRLQMATDPLDLQDLLAELTGEEPPWAKLPQETTIGHIHLHVSNLPRDERFYHEVLGFDVMTRYGASASFLSAGGYHHHVGINVWAGVGAAPAPADAAGLRWYTIDLPSREALDALLERLEETGVTTEEREEGLFLRDRSENGIVLRVA